MNSDNRRIFIAGLLIFIVLLLQPYYYKWLGIEPTFTEEDSTLEVLDVISKDVIEPEPEENVVRGTIQKKQDALSSYESFITIHTDLYSAKISNRGGGSIVFMEMKEQNGSGYRYKGSFDNDGEHLPEALVTLAPLELNGCSPCLSSFDPSLDDVYLFNNPFSPSTNYASSYTIEGEDTVELNFSYTDKSGMIIYKSVVFKGNSYESVHEFSVINSNAFWGNNLEIRWDSGLMPTEQIPSEDVTYASAISGQSGEIEEINQTSPDDGFLRQSLEGNTDWVAVRNKYFAAAIVADTKGDYATLSSKNINLYKREITPQYTASVGYPLYDGKYTSRLYLGPLDLDHISKTGTDLDEIMNFGFTVIRPIGKAVLWFLKFLHNTLKLNYGFALIIFAIIVRIITGPLTRKSFESSQKMQAIQPKVKKVQAKYKNDPQKMNQEVMALYRDEGVNPLGGCLPMLLQMPLLWALFVVFRSTIEFRGSEFMLWITDLSQPDVIFNLPFSIPIYGGHVAVLPILMGISIFLTQRMSMATMDKAQRPMMYIMNGFFVLLFNQFPSGLNLYYTVYNLLNFFQQRSIRQASSS